jgi:hypothetical protein
MTDDKQGTSNQHWYALQDPGDKAPYAVMGFNWDEGLPRRFVPGEGLVDWPSLAGYVVNGEPGAHEIDEATAIKMMKAGVGKVSPANVEYGRGKGPTVQPPTG